MENLRDWALASVAMDRIHRDGAGYVHRGGARLTRAARLELARLELDGLIKVAGSTSKLTDAGERALDAVLDENAFQLQALT